MPKRSHRRARLVVLGLLAGAVTAIAVYRRQQLARNRAEFASRYS